MTEDVTARPGALGAAFNADRETVAAWVGKHLADEACFASVIPLVHELQDEGFNAYVIAVLAGDPVGHSAAIRDMADEMPDDSMTLWLDHLELQPNLEMFYPGKGGVEAEPGLTQFLEVIQSKPEFREHYYNMQYTFSGPTMRRLFDRDLAGRFIGFECVDRLAGAAEPLFDVIHVSGFTPGQLERAKPHFQQAFEDAANAIGEPSGRAIMDNWNTQREGRGIPVEQLHEVSLASRTLEIAIP